MKVNYFYTLMLLYLSGVLSGVINENSRLSKRYNMSVPNANDIKFYSGKNHYKLDSMYFQDRYLTGTKCVYRPERGCGMSGNFIIKLDYSAKCSYGDSSIKKIAVYDDDGDSVSEIINLTKIGQIKSSGRYIDIYFKNGCKISATYNYRNTQADSQIKSLA